MDGDEVLTAEFRISKLMNVIHGSTGYRAYVTFAIAVVTQALLTVEGEDCFRHQTCMNPNDAVRTVVIVNRRLLAGPPTDHEHLDGFITTNSMAPVITFLESDVRLQIDIADRDF